MKKIFLVSLVIIWSCTKEKTIKAPLAPSVMAVDEYHGQQIEDPYRNLENLKDSTVVDWFRNQGAYGTEILENIPGRQGLIDDLVKYDLENQFSISNLIITNNREYYYLKTEAGENIAKLYCRKSSKEKEFLVYNPEDFSEEKNYVINYFKPNWKGDKIAVSLSKNGEDISEIIVIEVSSKKVLPGIVENCKPSIGGIQWLSDDTGFIYLHVPITDPTHKDYSINTSAVVYTLGTNPKELNTIFSKEHNPEINLNPEDFPVVLNKNNYDGYLFVYRGGVSDFKDMYFSKETDVFSSELSWNPLCKKSDKVKKIILKDEDVYFLTAKKSSNFEIGKTSILKPDFENYDVIVPSSENFVISNFEITNDGLFYTTIKNGIESKLYYVDDTLKTKEIVLPNYSGGIFIESISPQSSFLRIWSYGYISPLIYYHYNVSNNKFLEEGIIPTTTFKDFENLTVETTEVPSDDGELIPLSIIRKKNTKLNGSNPTLMFGYGSYGYNAGPFYSPEFLTWVVKGGILAVAHVRGGGEKGDAWHKGGYKTTKSNTWKDMIACTEYMVSNGYTNPKKTAIWGSSAGGIMAGRAMTDRPDLYSAVILSSPAMNMLRSEVQPNGQNSIKEFGTVKIKEEFEALLEMDSYHHIKKDIHYPATLVTGGMNDGRVVIWDPGKFVARLQASNISNKPILFPVKFDTGHGTMNTGRMDRIKQYTDTFSFAFWQTGHPDYQPE